MPPLLGVFFSEWRALPRRLGRVRGLLLYVAVILLLGYLLPPLIGSAFFDPYLMLAYASLSVLFLSPVLCQSVSEDRGRSLPPQVLSGKVAAAASFGVLSSVLLIAVRAVGVNREIRAPHLLLPDPAMLAWMLIMGAAIALLGCAAAVRVTLRASSAESARRVMRTGFFVLLLVVVSVARFAPDEWRVAFALQLTTETLPRFGAVVTLLLVAGAAGLLYGARRDPRYSGSLACR